jgi:ABC-type transporter Mla MlaB component
VQLVNAVAHCLRLLAILESKQACLLACLLRLVACLFKQAKRLCINLQASKQADSSMLAWLLELRLVVDEVVSVAVK